MPPDVSVETSGPWTEGALRELEGRGLLLHNGVWDWSLAHPHAAADQDALDLTRTRLRATGAPWLSLHPGFAAAAVRFERGMQATSRVLDRDEARDRMVRTVRVVGQHLDVPVLLENLDAQASRACDHVCEPSFISDVVRASDAGFLLDLAHAQVSAARLGMSVHAYLAALPLERMREVHVSGPRWRRGGVLGDAHATLRSEDLALLDVVLHEATPWAVTLEFAGSAAALLGDVAKLATRIERI
jgi:Uncharacterized protein conserved in bacteria